MSRSSILIILGVLTLLAPFSGLPGAFRTLLAVALGAAVLGIGVAERSREQRRMIATASASVPEPATVALPPEPRSASSLESLLVAEPAAHAEPIPAKPARARAPRTVSPI